MIRPRYAPAFAFATCLLSLLFAASGCDGMQEEPDVEPAPIFVEQNCTIPEGLAQPDSASLKGDGLGVQSLARLGGPLGELIEEDAEELGRDEWYCRYLLPRSIVGTYTVIVEPSEGDADLYLFAWSRSRGWVRVARSINEDQEADELSFTSDDIPSWAERFYYCVKGFTDTAFVLRVYFDDGEDDEPEAGACPRGWEEVSSNRGVTLCSRRFQRGSGTVDDHALIVDLERGAQVLSFAEPTSEPSPDNPSPSFTRRHLSAWWDRIGGIQRLSCIVNGALFESLVSGPSELTFPVKNLGELQSAGSDTDDFLRMLIFEGRSARIATYRLETNDFEEVDDYLTEHRTAVVGRDPDLTNGSARDARTYAATRDSDGDGEGDIVIFYASPSASSDEMEEVLEETFEADRAMMFDGGGSVQMMCNGTHYTSNRRPVPHVFAVFRASS